MNTEARRSGENQLTTVTQTISASLGFVLWFSCWPIQTAQVNPTTRIPQTGASPSHIDNLHVSNHNRHVLLLEFVVASPDGVFNPHQRWIVALSARLQCLLMKPGDEPCLRRGLPMKQRNTGQIDTPDQHCKCSSRKPSACARGTGRWVEQNERKPNEVPGPQFWRHLRQSSRTAVPHPTTCGALLRKHPSGAGPAVSVSRWHTRRAQAMIGCGCLSKCTRH